MIAVVANQYSDSGVDKLPYNEHQFAMPSSQHTKKLVENSLCNLFYHPLVAGFILPFFNTILSPNFNLYFVPQQYRVPARANITPTDGVQCDENPHAGNRLVLAEFDHHKSGNFDPVKQTYNIQIIPQQ